jgi:hypothetical protein
MYLTILVGLGAVGWFERVRRDLEWILGMTRG